MGDIYRIFQNKIWIQRHGWSVFPRSQFSILRHRFSNLLINFLTLINIKNYFIIIIETKNQKILNNWYKNGKKRLSDLRQPQYVYQLCLLDKMQREKFDTILPKEETPLLLFYDFLKYPAACSGILPYSKLPPEFLKYINTYNITKTLVEKGTKVHLWN